MVKVAWWFSALGAAALLLSCSPRSREAGPDLGPIGPGAGGTPGGEGPWCSGAGFDELSEPALIGLTDLGLAAILADGTRREIALGADLAAFSYYRVQRTAQTLAMVGYPGSGGLRVVRLDGGAQLGVDVEIPGAEALYGGAPITIEADRSLVFAGRYGSELRVLPDGNIERSDSTAPTAEDPPERTPEGYYIREDADVPGWQIVTVPSNVVPWEAAFYEVATGRVQEVRHRSSWRATESSGGRIVYLGDTPEGPGLIDEGVDDERMTALPVAGSEQQVQLYGSDTIVRVVWGSVPVAWFDRASRSVTVLSDVLSLLQAGAFNPWTGDAWQVLVLDGVPRRAVGKWTMDELDFTGLELPAAAQWRAYGSEPVLLAGDGVPALWIGARSCDGCEPGAGETRFASVDRDRVLGADPGAAEAESFAFGEFVLTASGGLPRSRTEIATGMVSPVDFPGSSAGLARTLAVGARALVTLDGRPRFLVEGSSGEVSALSAEDTTELDYDSTMVSPPWAVGSLGLDPQWRVNVDTAAVERFAPAPWPAPYGFYDARWSDDPENHPATWDLQMPILTSEGNLLGSFRDESTAGVYARAAADTGWTPLGAPFTGATWVRAQERPTAWVLESGQAYDCYCTFSNVSWTAPPDGVEPLLTEAVQIVPRSGAAGAAVTGTATLTFHESQACVLVEPSTNVGEVPFVLDLLEGRRASLEGMSSIQWIPADAGGSG